MKEHLGDSSDEEEKIYIARKIVIDHLVEDIYYYEKLKKMEKGDKNE